MLKIVNLSKSFEGIKAVNQCSLEVEKATITGLIGPNGAGKTTLFNLISGIYKPDNGEILFKGDHIGGLKPHEVFDQGIIRTFQITRELKNMTVLENLKLVPSQQKGESLWNTWLRPHRVYEQEKEITSKAHEVMEFVDLRELENEYAKNLSGGQKKLLEFARTLMAEPEVILLDEPGAGINPTLMKKLNNYIKKVRDEQKITFFLIEHDMDLVMNLCNPIIVMSNGSKLLKGTPQEVQSNEEVLDAYLGGTS